MRSQHHALTTPASAATGSRIHEGPAAITAPRTVSAANVARIALTLAHDGRSRHHCVVIALWCTITEIITTTGTATIHRYESESTAVANSSTTHGIRIIVEQRGRPRGAANELTTGRAWDRRRPRRAHQHRSNGRARHEERPDRDHEHEPRRDVHREPPQVVEHVERRWRADLRRQRHSGLRAEQAQERRLADSQHHRDAEQHRSVPYANSLAGHLHHWTANLGARGPVSELHHLAGAR